MDSTTFKVIGIVTIIVLTLFLCDPARGADLAEVNTWSAVHELLTKDFGCDNWKRAALIEELDVINALVAYTKARKDGFDSVNGLDNVELRAVALNELIKRTNHAVVSLVRDITWFVKNHKGI